MSGRPEPAGLSSWVKLTERRLLTLERRPAGTVGAGGGGGGSTVPPKVDVSQTAPTNPTEGDIWVQSGPEMIPAATWQNATNWAWAAFGYGTPGRSITASAGTIVLGWAQTPAANPTAEQLGFINVTGMLAGHTYLARMTFRTSSPPNPRLVQAFTRNAGSSTTKADDVTQSLTIPFASGDPAQIGLGSTAQPTDNASSATISALSMVDVTGAIAYVYDPAAGWVMIGASDGRYVLLNPTADQHITGHDLYLDNGSIQVSANLVAEGFFAYGAITPLPVGSDLNIIETYFGMTRVGGTFLVDSDVHTPPGATQLGYLEAWSTDESHGKYQRWTNATGSALIQFHRRMLSGTWEPWTALGGGGGGGGAPVAHGTVYQSAASISSGSVDAVTLCSFTLPAAGTYDITYFARVQTAAIASAFGVIALFDNVGNRVANSEIMGWYFNQTAASGASTGTGRIIVTVGAAVTYTLRGWAGGGTVTFRSDDTGGRTGVTWMEMSAVGPQGPIGPAGPSGGGATFVQGTPATVWNITHALPFQPNVSVVDSGGAVVEGDVVYLSGTAIRVTFSAAFSGSAYLS